MIYALHVLTVRHGEVTIYHEALLLFVSLVIAGAGAGSTTVKNVIQSKREEK